MQSAPEKFGPVAIFLHWAIALLIAVTVVFGLIVGDADDAEATQQALAIHQSIGVSIVLLAAFRLIWRLFHPAPALPIGTPRSQRVAAAATHGLLYVTLFALPITGYVGLAARGRDITVYGLFDLPRIVPLGLRLSHRFQTLHDNGQYLLYALLVAHVGAALYHHFILKDAILRRMLPQIGQKSPRDVL